MYIDGPFACEDALSLANGIDLLELLFHLSGIKRCQKLFHLNPLTSEVVGAPQMTLQQYVSTLPCFPLPSGNLETDAPHLITVWIGT